LRLRPAGAGEGRAGPPQPVLALTHALEGAHSNDDRAIVAHLELGDIVLSLTVGLARSGGESRAEGTRAGLRTDQEHYRGWVPPTLRREA